MLVQMYGGSFCNSKFLVIIFTKYLEVPFWGHYLWGMSRTVTPIQAFEHFLENVQHPIEGEIYEAKYAMQGKRPYKLGDKRIKTLLEKYAPDKYEFRDVVIIKE